MTLCAASSECGQTCTIVSRAQLVVQALDSCVCMHVYACMCKRLRYGMPWHVHMALIQGLCSLHGGAYAVALVQGLIMTRVHWQVYAMHPISIMDM